MPRDLSAYPYIQAPSIWLPGSVYYVSKLADFPAPSGGVITLPAGSTWSIFGSLDLQGNRLLCLGIVTIVGTSSETSALFSTGLPASQYLITSSYTLPIRNITIGCPTDTFVFNLTGDGSNGLDIYAVNFGNTITCGGLGTISNFTNVIIDTCAFLNIKGGLSFGGTIGTIAVNNSLFNSSGHTGPYLIFPTGLTITRRIRVIYSSLVVYAQGIDLQTTSIPNNGFILDTVNFTGGGTYLVNITANDVRSSFTQTIGVPVSSSVCEVRIKNNATATTIGSAGTWSTIAGTNSDITLERFTLNSSLEVQYVGAQTQRFYISAKASVSSGNNVDLGITYTINGNDANIHNTTLTTSGSGDLGVIQCYGIDQLQQNDVVKIWITNYSNTTSVTVKDLAFIIFQINT